MPGRDAAASTGPTAAGAGVPFTVAVGEVLCAGPGRVRSDSTATSRYERVVGGGPPPRSDRRRATEVAVLALDRTSVPDPPIHARTA